MPRENGEKEISKEKEREKRHDGIGKTLEKADVQSVSQKPTSQSKEVAGDATGLL